MAADLSAFPLPPLVKITGPISQPLPLLPGQDRTHWWGYTSSIGFVAIPPEVVDEMMDSAGIEVWNPQPGESEESSVERVRQELNAAAERLGGSG